MTDRLVQPLGQSHGRLLGNYRLTRLLGKGGFAEVYLGEHTHLGTMAAIKVLHTQVSQEGIAPFQQEARLLASLKHPHIVRVFDFGIEEQVPYLVMDYAPNGTLRTRHANGSQLPISTVVDYVKQVAEALQYAHDRKIVHRDIKPENMLIGESNEILLSDFGIALIAHSSRSQLTQDVIGTVAYMSPEQIQGKPRPTSDQYSLGIVVYEWLNGMYPFRGSFTELCTQHMFAPLPPLREKVPTISPEVEHVVATALAKDPKQRFESVHAFAAALEQASQNTLPTKPSRPLGISSPLYTPLSLSRTGMPLTLPAKVPAPQAQQPVQVSVMNTTLSDPVVPLPAPALDGPPTLLIPAQTASKPRAKVSRRAVLIGATSVVGIVAVGIGILVITRQQVPPDRVVTSLKRRVTPREPTATTQTPTATPQNQPFIYRGHSDQVWSVAWSPDGKRIVSGSNDKTAQVWSASDGDHVFPYRRHDSSVDIVTWSPDGEWIASGSDDKTVQVWNANDGGRVLSYTGHDFANVNAVAWSPNGMQIASGSTDQTVQVWNANDGSHAFTHKGHSDMLWGVAWSPDGKRIASGSADKTVQVWNANDGSHAFIYKGHSDHVHGVAWSPNGKRIASSSADKTVQVWNANDGSHAFIYKGHLSTVRSVAWSPDGKWIASGSEDSTVQVWDASDGKNVSTYQGHTSWVYSVAWSPDGKHIASGSADKTVQVWNVE
jgi:WD40 repeat protein